MEAPSDSGIGQLFSVVLRDFLPDRLGDLAILLNKASLSHRYSATTLALKPPLLKDEEAGHALDVKDRNFGGTLEVIFYHHSGTVRAAGCLVIQLSLNRYLFQVSHNLRNSDVFVFYSDEFCGMMNMFHMILSNELFCRFSL